MSTTPAKLSRNIKIAVRFGWRQSKVGIPTAMSTLDRAPFRFVANVAKNSD